MNKYKGVITTIKVWSRNGKELAIFHSTLHKNSISNIFLNDVIAFMADTNRNSGSIMHFGETLVVSVNEAKKTIILSKLKEIFREFKQTIL